MATIYLLVSGNTPHALQRQVNGLIKKGWTPQGGVCTMGSRVLQSMVRVCPSADDEPLPTDGSKEPIID